MFSSSDTFRLMTTLRLLLIIGGDIVWLLCAFLQPHALSASFLLPSRKEKNISRALHLLCLPWEATLTQTLQSKPCIFCCSVLSEGCAASPTCSGTGQPMYNLVLGWGLITVPKNTESNEQFESSRQHLNTNRGSEWWIKHVLYQIYFFQTNRG